MKRAKVTLSNGEVVGGYQSPTAGLVIAKSPASGMWLIVHARSGMYVAQVHSLKQAERLAIVLRSAGTWERTAHDVVADGVMRHHARHDIRRAKALYDVEETEAALARARKREEKRA